MTTTAFVDGSTLSAASWANDTDTLVYNLLTSPAGTNTITGTGPASMTAYAAGQLFTFIPANTNTGATTLNITPSGGAALGAKNIYSRGAALVGGEIEQNVPILVWYDGTQFQMLNSVLKSGIVDLSIGSLVGIKFDATQNPSADVNTLDDYEEGVWTPSIGGNATYTTQTGFYTKIGRLVYIKASLEINVLGTGSTTTISGLPFTPANDATASPIAIGYFGTLAVNVLHIGGAVQPSSTGITFYSLTAAGASATVSPAIFGNSARVDFSGFYNI